MRFSSFRSGKVGRLRNLEVMDEIMRIIRSTGLINSHPCIILLLDIYAVRLILCFGLSWLFESNGIEIPRNLDFL